MHSITIPRLGWSMEEGIFGKWLKQPGEFVCVGDLLFELEGEKAASEVESLDSGILCVPNDAPKPGERVLVGQTIAFLLADGEAMPSSVGANSPTTHSSSSMATIREPREFDSSTHNSFVAPKVRGVAPVMGPAARRLARQLGLDAESASFSDPTGRMRTTDLVQSLHITNSETQQRIVATPRARKLGRELGIEMSTINGSGRGGRIRERDVAAASIHLKQVAKGQLPTARTGEVSYKPTASGKLVSASKSRLALVQRVTAAVQAAPVTLSKRVDATELTTLRSKWKADASSPRDVPTIGEILIKLVATALREDSTLNACWLDDGVWQYDPINIAIAVDTTAGLLAPVIPQADCLSLKQISRAARELTEQARSGTISSSQLSGGTFTISNLGTLDIDEFTPLLNLPQAAILGVGRILQVPLVRNGVVEVGNQITLSLTFDHRVTDGAPAARWLQLLSRKIEAAILD